MRFFVLVAVACTLYAADDAREIVRKSVDLDQSNWTRMKDYVWSGHSTEHHFDSKGKMKSEETAAWETVMLGGEPYRRDVERNGKPLPPAELRKEQEKLDKTAARLAHETPEQRDHRLAEYEKRRRKERDFLREIPEAYDLRIESETPEVWVIAGAPKAGYRPKDRDAKAFAMINGRIWIDKATYQWVRLEAQTTGAISFGLVLARLNPGAKLVFEQMQSSDALWLPKRLYMQGTGRLALIKKIAMDEEITWSNYRKFQVDSKVVPLPER